MQKSVQSYAFRREKLPAKRGGFNASVSRMVKYNLNRGDEETACEARRFLTPKGVTLKAPEIFK